MNNADTLPSPLHNSGIAHDILQVGEDIFSKLSYIKRASFKDWALLLS